MYKKIESINSIKSAGLNIHNFKIPGSLDEFVCILREFGYCTIRTDHVSKTQDLPFYIWDSLDNKSLDNAHQIWNNAMILGYKLIVSDGIKYDRIQDYNMVLNISEDGEFLCEASSLKIPLRHMYRYPLLSIFGNIFDRVGDWNILNQTYGIDRFTLRDDIWLLYETGLFDRWLEVTKYPKPVGIRNQNIVFWQI